MNRFALRPLVVSGLTLVELLVTLSIMSILTTVAAPSFTEMLHRWTANQALANLESALVYAHSEGIRRGGGIVLVREISGSNCVASNASDWRCGWRIINTSDNNTPLQSSSKTFPQTSINASSNSDSISIDRWGNMTLATAGNSFSFLINPNTSNQTNGTKLCINTIGHTRKIQGDQNCS